MPMLINQMTRVKKKFTLSSKFIENLDDKDICLLKVLNRTENLRIPKTLLDTLEFKNAYLETDKDIKDYILHFTSLDTTTLEYIFNPQKLKKTGLYFTERKVNVAPIDIQKVTKLLQAYNSVRDTLYSRKDPAIHANPVSQKPSMYKHYNNMIKFFEDNRIEDWHEYFYVLFASLNWKFVWSLKSAYGPRAFDMYQNNLFKFKSEVLDIKEPEVKEIDRWTQIFTHIEDIKRRLITQHKEKICLSRIEDYLGYHPKSLVCQGCGLQEECKGKIQEYFVACTGKNQNLIKIREQP